MADKKVTLWMSIKDGVSAASKKIATSWQKNTKAMEKSALQFTAVFAGLVAGVYKSVEAFRLQDRVDKDLENTLKSTGNAAGLTADEVKNMAAELQKTTGVSNEITQSGQNMLLTFTNIGKDVFPEVTETLLDMTAKMNHGKVTQEGMKMQAIQLGKALNDPAVGLTALTRVGVTFTEQQKSQIKQLVKTGDTMAAQKLMLAELKKEFGGTASVDSFEKSMRSTEAAVGDTMEIIGSAFAPIIQDIGAFIKETAEKFGEIIEAHKDLVVPVTAAIGILTGLSAAIGGVAVALPIIAPMFVALTGPIGIAVAAISGITAALLYFKNSNSEVAIKVRAAWETLGGIIAKYAEAISLSIKFRFGEARQAYKDLATLVADSKNIFAENVEAEKASLEESVKNNADAIEQKKAQQIAQQEESFALAQEYDEIRKEYEAELAEERLAFTQATHDEKMQYLIDALGKERVYKEAMQAQELISQKKFNDAREIEEKLYADAVLATHKKKLEDEAKATKNHRAADMQGLIIQKLQELSIVENNEQAKRDIADATRSFMGNMRSLMRSDNKAMFEVGKRAAQAEALINTYLSATKAFTSLAGIPYVGPALGIAAAAAATAAGLMNVRSIEQTQFQAANQAYAPGDGATVKMGEAGNPEWIVNQGGMRSLINEVANSTGNIKVNVIIAGSEIRPAIIEIEKEKQKMNQDGTL
jgi:hypothetical protein